MDSTDVKKEYEAFIKCCLSTPLQQERHGGDEIETIYGESYQKITWSMPIQLRLPRQVTEECIKYSLEDASLYHGLSDTKMVTRLPALRFKPGYQGRWCRNPGSNVIIAGRLFFNGIPLAQIPEGYCDHYIQNFHTDKRISDVLLGNVPELIEWNNSLPAYIANFMLPWFFTDRVNSYFPIYKCFSADNLEQRFMVRHLEQLVYCRNSEGSSVKLEEAILDSTTLPVPEVKAEAFILTEPEIATFHCNELHNILMYNDIIKLDVGEHTRKLGECFTFTIKEKLPIICLLWSVSNGQELSKYTTNAGVSPILHTTLVKGRMTIFDKLESVETEKYLPSQKMHCAPSVPGYHSYLFALNWRAQHNKPGLLLNDGEMKVQLIEPRDESDQTFALQVYAIVNKKMQFDVCANTEMERRMIAKKSVVSVYGE